MRGGVREPLRALRGPDGLGKRAATRNDGNASFGSCQKRQNFCEAITAGKAAAELHDQGLASGLAHCVTRARG